MENLYDLWNYSGTKGLEFILFLPKVAEMGV